MGMGGRTLPLPYVLSPHRTTATLLGIGVFEEMARQRTLARSLLRGTDCTKTSKASEATKEDTLVVSVGAMRNGGE